MAKRDGHQVVESLLAFAQPAGPTVQSVYEAYRDEILRDAASHGPFDMVLLFLHGAMVSAECDDCEGDLIARIRAIVGPRAAIGAVLDLHCHLTAQMVEASDAIITVKEYPHIDFLERSAELYEICEKTAKGQYRPTSALFDCRMVGFYPTTTEPMKSLVDRFRVVETRAGVLSVSFAHGFPWGDTPDTGSRMLAITDNDPALAASVARELGMEIYAAREALLPRFAGIEAALDQARQSNGLAVLADTADNAGGGAPSDNLALLEAMLDRKVERAAFGAVWDPICAQVCADAGVGARLSLRLGGKCGPASGAPLDLTVTVRAVHHDFHQGSLGGSRVPMGLCAWVEIGGVDVVINSIRTQVFSPDAFTGLGIDLTGKRIVALKSSWHFQAAFGPIADAIIPVATPGAIQMDFAAIDYRKKRDQEFFPRVRDPLGANR